MLCLDGQEVDKRERKLISQISRWSSKAMLPNVLQTQIYMNIYHYATSLFLK